MAKSAGAASQPRAKVAATESSSSLTQLLVVGERASKPLGVALFGACFTFKSQASKRAFHQALVLLLTFIAYTAFHMSRRPLSVVKNVLNRDCSRLKPKTVRLTEASLDESAARVFISRVASGYQQQQQQQQQQQAPSITSISPTGEAALLDAFNYINNDSNSSSNNNYNNYDYDEPPQVTTLAPGRPNGQLHLQPGGVAGAGALLHALSNATSSPQASKDTSCDWAPFNDDATANKLLAALDTSFLLSYAVFMFISGFAAERTNLRYFISMGALISGLGLIAFGMSYSLDVHSMAYFVLVQVISGAAQTSGWPVVVTCVSNWFDRAKLGTIYGLWNSHTNLGNILGATIAGYFVESDWGLSFIVPGALMLLTSLLMFLFLVPAPNDVQLAGPAAPLASVEQQQQRQVAAAGHSDGARARAYSHDESDEEPSGGRQAARPPRPPPPPKQAGAISFARALSIPGVLEYSFCLFFSKLVSYTFLYWLPRYITSSTSFNSQDSAYLSTPFDAGGIAGSILAGWLSDRFKANGIICNIMLLLAIPSMFLYQHYGARSSLHNILLQLLVGSLVNGPYCLITTAVSADLGTRVPDGRAMATVSAIIDGMGSLGAVLGPLFAGFVAAADWRSVFAMLMLADVLAALCIARVTVRDLRAKLLGARQPAPSSA